MIKYFNERITPNADVDNYLWQNFFYFIKNNLYVLNVGDYFQPKPILK